MVKILSYEVATRGSKPIATDGWKLLALYRFDPATGGWQHKGSTGKQLVRLSQLGYDSRGVLTFPTRHDRAPESDLARYLAEARSLLDSLDGPGPDDAPTSLPADFERLRWFDLPAASLQ